MSANRTFACAELLVRDPGLDFQPRRPSLLVGVLLLAAVVLGSDAVFEYTRLGEALGEAESRLAQSERRLERLRASERQEQPGQLLNPEENRSLQLAVSAITVDWEGLYRRIDAASGEEVSLLAVSPNLAGSTVHISGEARDMKAALAFVESLKQPPLVRVVLVSHQIRQSDPQRPVFFEISAAWSPAS
jgi:hypothetical protein